MSAQLVYKGKYTSVYSVPASSSHPNRIQKVANNNSHNPVILMERKFLESIPTHPNIVGLLPCNVTDPHECQQWSRGWHEHFCIEHMDGVLIDVLNEYRRYRVQLPTTVFARIVRDLDAAITHVHNYGIVHCDIKPDNILFKLTQYPSQDAAQPDIFALRIRQLLPQHPDQECIRRRFWLNRELLLAYGTTYKLSDFGNSYHAGNISEKRHTSTIRCYRSPTELVSLPPDQNIDRWAMGCTTFEIVTGQTMFPERFTKKHISKIQQYFGPLVRGFWDKVSGNKLKYRPDVEYKTSIMDNILSALTSLSTSERQFTAELIRYFCLRAARFESSPIPSPLDSYYNKYPVLWHTPTC